MSTETPSTSAEQSDEEIVELRRELAALRRRVTELEQRINSTSTLPPAASDYRDARVLDVLSRGQTLHLRQLRSIYFDLTDIRDKETVRDRIKDLVESEVFEKVGQQRWRYVASSPADGSDS